MALLFIEFNQHKKANRNIQSTVQVAGILPVFYLHIECYQHGQSAIVGGFAFLACLPTTRIQTCKALGGIWAYTLTVLLRLKSSYTVKVQRTARQVKNSIS